MANFTPTKKQVSDFNNGIKYVNKVDTPSADDFNNVIESQLYSQNFAESIADTPDTSEASQVGVPSVTLINNIKNGVVYKKFKFANMKGDSGAVNGNFLNSFGNSTINGYSQAQTNKLVFARVYRNWSELGIDKDFSIDQLFNAMIDRSKALFAVSTYLTDFYGQLKLNLPVPFTGSIPFFVMEAYKNDMQRMVVRITTKAPNKTQLYAYEGFYYNTGATNVWTGWKQIIDDNSAQTITGVKTFSASPLVPTTPSGPSAAVAKSYVDSIVSATNISYFTTKEQVKEVVPNWVYKQSGSTVAWSFTTLLNNIRIAGHPRSVVCIYFDGVNAYLGDYKDKECYLTAFITEESLNRRVEIFFPKTANTLAHKALYIGGDNNDFVYQESIFVPELYFTRGDIGITTLSSGVYELRLDAKDTSDSYYFIIQVRSNTTTFGTQSGVGLFGPKVNCLSFSGKINFYIDNGADLEEYKAVGYFHYRKIKDSYGSNQSGKIVNWIPVE